MKYKLQDLIDIEHFQNLQDSLNAIYPFPSAIIDNDGNILTATAWQDLCTQFHRKNKETEILCIKSDQYIKDHIHEAKPTLTYRCPHGLVDNAIPIIIEGIHYGSFFTGQFFLEKPDMEVFRAQAQKYKFDEDTYLEAVKNVPVWTQKQLDSYLLLIKELIAVISERGLTTLKGIENRKLIEARDERHKSILKTAMDGYWLTDPEGRLLEVNDSYCCMSGYSEPELLTMSIADLEAVENSQRVTQHLQEVITQESDRFESKHRRKDGTIFDVEVSVQFRNDDGGQCVCFLRDITERKQTEKALRDNEQKYRNLFENMSQGVFYQNADGFLNDYNNATLEMLGISPDQFLGKTSLAPHWNVVNEEGMDLPGDEHPSMVALQTGKPVHDATVGVYNPRTKTMKWLLVNAIPQINKPGEKPHQVFVTLQDITSRKQAEDALKESEMRFRALFEQTGGYCMILDPDTRDGIPLIIDANEAACAAHGFTRQEFIGRSVATIDDEDGKRLVRKRTAEIMTGEPFYEENVHVRKDGTTFPVAVNAKRIDIGNGRSLILTTEYDITERKTAEKQLKESKERFELAMEAARDGLYDWNLVTNEIYYSPGWKRMLGYQPDEIPNDFSVWEALTEPEDIRKSWEMQQELVQKKRDRFELEFKMKHKDGYWVDILSRAKALFDDSGKAVRIVGTHVDITNRKKMEAQIQQSQKMESIGNLAGGIAHDFNNILSSIIGFTELALDAAPKGSTQRDDLEEIYIAGNRAKELVQQILAFARQSEEKTKPVRLSDIITEALKLLRPSTPANIDIRSNINSTAKVMGNTSQLHQVVMNLCTNAIHSLQKAGGLLEIGLRNTFVAGDSEPKTLGLPVGEYVELTVTDNGSGIDSAIIDQIFEPYFTTKGVGEGTGMGLAMVKGIIESYGGDIAVKSEQGKRTAFIIRLPVATGRRIEAIVQADLVASGAEHILFIDDEPPIARMGSRMLESLGYTVTIRTSSIEALELFREKPDVFDLVVTDMTMPSMTGDVLSVELRKIRHDIPIILCTGYSNKISQEGAKLIGLDAFAYKPFTKPDIAKTIREVLDKNRTSSI